MYPYCGAGASVRGMMRPTLRAVAGLLQAGRPAAVGYRIPAGCPVTRQRGAYQYSPRARKLLMRSGVVILAVPILVILGMTGLMIWVLLHGLSIRSQVEPVSGWQQTSGWIADVRTVDAGRGPVYHPVIAFRARDRVVTFNAPTTTSVPTAGARTEVSYDPRDPARAHDLSMGSAWEIWFYGGLVGTLVCAAVVAVMCWFTFTRLRPVIHRAATTGTTVFGEGRHARSR
jgi:Protein of unknown function (DUF3592)